MNMERAYRALEKTARMNNTSVEYVIQDIEAAIAEAISTSEPAVLEIWRQIPCEGDRPNAAELVAYLGGLLERQI